MELGAPAHQRVAVRLGGERREQRAHQDRLGGEHARVRRHLERAELDQALAAVRRQRIEQLVDRDLRPVGRAGDVDQQVAQQRVDVPRRRRFVEPRQRELELVQRVVARFIHARRLRGRPDEQAGEHVRQRRMVLRERDEAREQAGVAQPRRALR